nr:hypothetical protein [Bacillus cereus]
MQYRSDVTGHKWHSSMVTKKSPSSFQINQHTSDQENDEIVYILESEPSLKRGGIF